MASAAHLERYEWRSTREHGKRASDWSRAAACEDCGRAIVHVYTVAGRELGADCAAVHLGLADERRVVAAGKWWQELERNRRRDAARAAERMARETSQAEAVSL